MLILRFIAAHFVLFAAFALVPNCLAQDVNCFSVRVLNLKSGKPISGIEVDMIPNHSENPRPGPNEPEIRIGKTNKHGTLKYCPPDPAPKTFVLSFRHLTIPDQWEQYLDLGQVLKTGVRGYASRQSPQIKVNVNVKPGEVVVFGRRWNLIEYLPAPDLP
jgi:hypothetical protein